MTNRNTEPFQGFPKDMPDFMWGLALNNEKPWFEAHRADYERCLNQPFRALARQVCDEMQSRFPGEAPMLHISRIYRDARRLYGRGPYNDHLWFSLGLTGQLYDPLPQFWFGIHAQCYTCGMGVWPAGGEQLERWRKSIDANPKKLAAIVRKLNREGDFTRAGALYKRPRGDPGPLLFPWYNARELGVEKDVWFDRDPPGPELAQTLVDDYARLMPLYQYLMAVCRSENRS